MSRIIMAIKRTFERPYTEPPVHFHAASGAPEVCYDLHCTRPQLTV